eukprot:2701447-Amphidinium_carterae.2
MDTVSLSSGPGSHMMSSRCHYQGHYIVTDVLVTYEAKRQFFTGKPIEQHNTPEHHTYWQY